MKRNGVLVANPVPTLLLNLPAASVGSRRYARGVGDRTIAWDSVDAWLFGSIGSENVRLPTAHLLRRADLADGQFAWSLGKLVGSGLVRVYEDWTLEVTDEGWCLLEDSRRGEPEYLEIVAERLAFLDPTPIKLTVPRKLLEAEPR